jgi:NAD+ diphosphatase
MRAAAAHPGPPLYLPVQAGELLVRVTDGSTAFPAQPPSGTEHLLGSLGVQPCVAIDVPDTEPPGDLSRVGLRELHGLVSDLYWSLASRAVQTVAWDRNHRFCGRCGTLTEPEVSERARRCPRCGLSAYPRLTPAIIVLVTRGEHDELALLAWGRRARSRHYSTVAGLSRSARAWRRRSAARCARRPASKSVTSPTSVRSRGPFRAS